MPTRKPTPPSVTNQKRRVAVIGAGVSGLTAAYVLQRSGMQVSLFEAQPRLGGHVHTHTVGDPDSGHLAVDSGFIVHNRGTYPSLTRLFTELGVHTRTTGMSLSVSCAECGLEYAGSRGVRALLPSGVLRRGRYLAMLTEIPRFHQAARRLLHTWPAGAPEPTLEQFVRTHRFSSYFTAHYLLALVSAVWSCPAGTALQYPVRYLFAFLDRHGMLQTHGAPAWRTVVGGAHTYVERIAQRLSEVRTHTPVRRLERRPDGVRIVVADNDLQDFDAAVVATHADQALALLAQPTALEQKVLGAFRYCTNPTVLHTDTTVLPHRRTAWASWNHHLPSCSPQDSAVQMSYHMNRLQGLTSSTNYLVTLNDQGTVAAEHVLARMEYQHPVYTPDSMTAQSHLATLNDATVAFAGAHHGWGFHEDGCAAGVAAATALGARW